MVALDEMIQAYFPNDDKLKIDEICKWLCEEHQYDLKQKRWNASVAPQNPKTESEKEPEVYKFVERINTVIMGRPLSLSMGVN